MARMPGATWLGEHGSPDRRMARYDVICIHTMAGRAPAHAAHFSVWGNGALGQSRDTLYQSAANYQGNHRVIAVECEDKGPEFMAWTGTNVPAFTNEECETIARVIVWAYHEHGIPIELCPDSKPGSRGVAYHRLGIEGNFGPYDFDGKTPGVGEFWSTSFGKVCPGDPRIHQLIDIIIPRARVLAGLDQLEETMGAYTVEIPASPLGADGKLKTVETVVGLPTVSAAGGASGISRVWATVVNGNSEMVLPYCHWRVANGDGSTYLVPYVQDGSKIRPLGHAVTNTEAPRGAVSLIVDSACTNGGSVVVEFR